MSIETATQRLNAALGGLETKIVQRLETFESENARLRGERDRLLAENETLKMSIQNAESAIGSGVSATSFVQLEKRNAEYRASLSQMLKDIDSLISRVSSAAQ